MNYDELRKLEKRFLEIKPDLYNLGLYGCGEGREIYNITVDNSGRVTMVLAVNVMHKNYSMHTHYVTRHPVLTPMQIKYILGKCTKEEYEGLMSSGWLYVKDVVPNYKQLTPEELNEEIKENLADVLSNEWGYCLNTCNFKVKKHIIKIKNIDWDTSVS